MSATGHHLSFEVLLDYWLHDTDTATTEKVDEHLMQCDACGLALDELVELGQSVRAAFRSGQLAAIVSEAFLARMKQHGLRIREYRLAHNGSIHCAVAPDDDLLVARVEVPLQGVRQLDAVTVLSVKPGVAHRLQDIPFDTQAGAVYYVPKLTEVRKLPRHDMTLTLFAQHDGGERELGRYLFHHGPWPVR